jgi:hypothetical protein
LQPTASAVIAIKDTKSELRKFIFIGANLICTNLAPYHSFIPPT